MTLAISFAVYRAWVRCRVWLWFMCEIGAIRLRRGTRFERPSDDFMLWCLREELHRTWKHITRR